MNVIERDLDDGTHEITVEHNGYVATDYYTGGPTARADCMEKVTSRVLEKERYGIR